MSSLLALHDTLAYKFFAIKKNMIAASRQYFQEVGISFDMYIVLRVIYEAPGSKQREISEICDKDANVIVKTIDRLERMGFVQRVRDETDRRAYTLYVTEAGTKVAEDFSELFVERQEACLGDLTEEEKKELRRLLDKILANQKNN